MFRYSSMIFIASAWRRAAAESAMRTTPLKCHVVFSGETSPTSSLAAISPYVGLGAGLRRIRTIRSSGFPSSGEDGLRISSPAFSSAALASSSIDRSASASMGRGILVYPPTASGKSNVGNCVPCHIPNRLLLCSSSPRGLGVSYSCSITRVPATSTSFFVSASSKYHPSELASFDTLPVE